MTPLSIIAAVLAENHPYRIEPTVLPETSLAELHATEWDRVARAMRIEDQFGFVVSDREEREWTHASDIEAMVAVRAPKAIEARSGETGTGSTVGESAVPQGIRQELQGVIHVI